MGSDKDACVVCGAAAGSCVVFQVIGEPVCKERPRLGAGRRTFTPKKTLDAEAAVRACWPRGIPPYTVPVRVDLYFAFETRRRKDTDNAAKLVLDAVNRSKDHPDGIAFTDDYLVESLTVQADRGVGKGNGETVVHITPIAALDRWWDRLLA